MRKLLSLLACVLSTHQLTAFAQMNNPADATHNSHKLTIKSSSFKNRAEIPAQYSCDGDDISPQLAWDNVPKQSQSLALILSDPDAPSGTFYHWVVFNIPPKIKELPAALTQLPQGAEAGKNTWGKQQYNGPCPPKGSQHRYIFTLYALDTKLSLDAHKVDAAALLDAMNNHIIEQATLLGVFKH